MLNLEQSIIDFLQQNSCHIGDDAAILPHINEDRVVSKDLLIEDVHFRLRWTPAQDLAHKALEVNLSDLAAMGAQPEGVFLGLAFPQTKAAFVQAFLEAFVDRCRERNIVLFGGDTTASPGALFLSVTAIGRGSIFKRRPQGRLGDVLFVAGNLGWAHMGWQALEHNWPGLDVFKNAFLRPTARVEEGLWLCQRQEVGALMDLSDGLLTDLPRLTAACGLGAHVFTLKPEAELSQAAFERGLNPQEVMILGGEDYGLLFSVAAPMAPQLAQDFFQHFSYPLHEIGGLSQEQTIHFDRNFGADDFTLRAYEHFPT